MKLLSLKMFILLMIIGLTPALQVIAATESHKTHQSGDEDDAFITPQKTPAAMNLSDRDPGEASGLGDGYEDQSQITGATSSDVSGLASAVGELKVNLVDPETKAKQGAATVEVDIQGIQMIDPAAANEEPRAGQGHLHYQLDDGPVIATPEKKLSFHQLDPGNHRITVMLADNRHRPIGPRKTIDVKI